MKSSELAVSARCVVFARDVFAFFSNFKLKCSSVKRKLNVMKREGKGKDLVH